METLHAPEMYVVIGDEYAKRLGYEGLVGSMGIIDSVLNALCGVTILSGKPDMIGKQTDIHIQDCILQEYGKKEPYEVIIDLNMGHILYTTDVELFEFTRDYLLPRHDVRVFNEVTDIHGVLDKCLEIYSHSVKKRDAEWMCFCLDSGDTDVSTNYLKLYEWEKKKKQRQEAFKELSKTTQVVNLTEQLKQQKEEQTDMQSKLNELLKNAKQEPKQEYTPMFSSTIIDIDEDDSYEEEDDDGPYDDGDYESAW